MWCVSREVELRKSLTWDRGMELARHHDVTAWTGLEVFFADPRSPWQRGTNENTNGLLRQYLPKGVSMAGLTQIDLDAVALKLNTRPRKALGYRTPTTVLEQMLHGPLESADARFKISFARRNSRFSRSSSFNRCRSSVVSPGRCPSSISTRRPHLRTVSGVGPSFSATEQIASHCDPLWRSASNTIRTARSRISTG